MLAAQQAVPIDRIELKLIETRNAAGPGFDDRLRESEIRKARDIECRDRSHFGKSGVRDLSRSKYRPREFSVERATDSRGLFAADLPRGVGDASHDIVKKAQDADAVSLPYFLRSPQPFQ